ncbi:hypothetical protein Dimus_013509 [Dionaea muscipula]
MPSLVVAFDSGWHRDLRVKVVVERSLIEELSKIPDEIRPNLRDLRITLTRSENRAKASIGGPRPHLVSSPDLTDSLGVSRTKVDGRQDSMAKIVQDVVQSYRRGGSAIDGDGLRLEEEDFGVGSIRGCGGDLGSSTVNVADQVVSDDALPIASSQANSLVSPCFSVASMGCTDGTALDGIALAGDGVEAGSVMPGVVETVAAMKPSPASVSSIVWACTSLFAVTNSACDITVALGASELDVGVRQCWWWGGERGRAGFTGGQGGSEAAAC